jgi:O-antigen/teichoic acid export membrane protein
LTSSNSDGSPGATDLAAAAPEPAEPEKAGPQVRRSLIISFTERYASIIINLLATALLARLLTPKDYGIYTVGVVVAGIASTLRDFGVVSFLIQEKNLTESQVRTAYGISMLIGLIAGAAIAILSGWIADFYGDDGVRRVLRVLAINFLLMPFGSAVLALIRREMNFIAMLWISLGSTVAGLGTSILLALVGDGYMSLAWGSLANSIVICAMAAAMRPREFRMLPSLKDWRRITSFGVLAMAGILVSSIGYRMPELVIGRLLGVSAVGIYGRAEGITTMFNRMVTGAVAPVVISAFAMHHRMGNPLKESFLGGLAMMTGIAWPFYGFLALMTTPVFHILFGAGWDHAIPTCRVLCIAASIGMMADLNGMVIQAMGEMKWNLYAHLIIQPVAVVLVLIAAQFNLVVVAGAQVVAASVSVVVFYRVIDRLIGVSLDDVVRRTAKSAGVAVCSIVAPVIVVSLMRTDGDHIWLPLIVAALGSLAGWLAGAVLFRHDLRNEILGMAAKVSFLSA